MKKKTTKILSSIMTMSVLFSALSISAVAVDYSNQDIIRGNVPVKFTPNSEITFDADGSYKVTHVAKSVSSSMGVGVEIGGNLADENPEAYEAENKAVLETIKNLPVYTYEEYYIAKEGAVAQYDQNGELIRVRGDYEYHSTLDQYLVNGSLPDGKYVGTYLEFSKFSSGSDSFSRAAATTITQSGRITTFGDLWPVIDKSKYPNCNTDPVKDINGVDYGDRIGTQNNKLRIGDVAIKSSVGIKYNTSIYVYINTSSGSYEKSMTKRDTMNERSNSILDIWRWDSPEWFTGTAQKPNDLYFGQKYTTSLSFESTSNYWKTA